MLPPGIFDGGDHEVLPWKFDASPDARLRIGMAPVGLKQCLDFGVSEA